MAESPSVPPAFSLQSGRRAFGLPELWAFVVVAGIWIILNLTLIRPNDFWWHVRAGQWIVEHGRVPTADLFSYTQLGKPWTYQMWLMESVFYLLIRLGGPALVIFFHAIVVGSAYCLLLLVNRRESGGNLRWAALATLAAAVVGIDNWNVRPQTISFLFFALTLYVVGRHEASAQPMRHSRMGDGAMWVLPPLYAVWANAHAGFVYGLALLGASLMADLTGWLRKQRRFPTALLLVTALCAAATLLTPSGLGMPGYVLGFLRHPVTRSLNLEFWPPTMRELGGQLFFGFVGTLVVLLVVCGYRPAAGETLRLVIFGALALVARRNVVWFGFVAAPAMAAALCQWGRARQRRSEARAGRPLLNVAIALLVGLLGLLSLPWLRPHLALPKWRQEYLSPETPVKAVAFLQTLPQPLRAFHSDGYGSYMIWASPEIPVFADTRIELYPAAQWYDYLALQQARYDWETILDRYGIDTLLLDRRREESLTTAARSSADWQCVYEDEQALILQRRGEP